MVASAAKRVAMLQLAGEPVEPGPTPAWQLAATLLGQIYEIGIDLDCDLDYYGERIVEWPTPFALADEHYLWAVDLGEAPNFNAVHAILDDKWLKIDTANARSAAIDALLQCTTPGKLIHRLDAALVILLDWRARLYHVLARNLGCEEQRIHQEAMNLCARVERLVSLGCPEGRAAVSPRIMWEGKKLLDLRMDDETDAKELCLSLGWRKNAILRVLGGTP